MLKDKIDKLHIPLMAGSHDYITRDDLYQRLLFLGNEVFKKYSVILLKTQKGEIVPINLDLCYSKYVVKRNQLDKYVKKVYIGKVKHKQSTFNPMSHTLTSKGKKFVLRARVVPKKKLVVDNVEFLLKLGFLKACGTILQEN